MNLVLMPPEIAVSGGILSISLDNTLFQSTLQAETLGIHIHPLFAYISITLSTFCLCFVSLTMMTLRKCNYCDWVANIHAHLALLGYTNSPVFFSMRLLLQWVRWQIAFCAPRTGKNDKLSTRRAA